MASLRGLSPAVTATARLPATAHLPTTPCATLAPPLASWARARAPFGPPSAGRAPGVRFVSSGIVEPRTVSIIGAPMAYGQPLLGVETAPTALREAGVAGVAAKLNWRVDDRGDIDILSPSISDPQLSEMGKNMYAVGVGNENLYNEVYDAAKEGYFPLTIGGDHSVAIGSCSGVLRARPNVGIIWVDAHADINIPGQSPSGNVHGMPVAFLMRLMEQDFAEIPGYEWMKDVPTLPTDSLVYIGLRDVDENEQRLIQKLGIKSFTMHEVDKYGIGKVMEMSLDFLAGAGPRPLHLSFDIDAVDPDLAPSTGTKVMGGLNYREAHFIAEEIADTGLLGSMDLVEVNPKLQKETSHHTVEIALALVESSLGLRILGSTAE